MPIEKINDINLFYKIFREGWEVDALLPASQALIILHGGPGISDHSLYVDFWSQFAVNATQVLFIDQRGNGQSDRGDERKWTIPQCAQDLNDFCEQLGIVQPIICGVSWGGYVAMSYAEKYPSKAKGFIFCSTEAKVSADIRKERFRALGGEPAAEAVWQHDTNPMKPGVHDAFIKHCLPHYAKNPYRKEELQHVKVNMPMHQKFLAEENLVFDFRESLAAISCPVLYFVGEADAAHPTECAEETASYIPSAMLTFVLVPEAGSPVYRDAPDFVKAAVDEFLE